ncbi:OsmC family protein [Streptococcus merionis]|uniref:OsmC/Ohr family protein n=1 Tax=Streptococcus merionis TaxID=400065 RepID=A0A239SSY3_9STRE|nr:OsmC family protein [Streptococcus merionis]SNU87844.1 OsmC/Ohr family protein [Streptococcus merionis]
MLYSVTAHNTQGIDGTVQLSNGKQVTTSHPLNNQSGFNPEEMIALAWSTCFKATLDTILKEKGLNHLSYIDVTVDLHKEPEIPGYYFAVKGAGCYRQYVARRSQCPSPRSSCPLPRFQAHRCRSLSQSKNGAL